MSQFTYYQKQAFTSLKKKKGFVATVVITMGTTLGALLCVLTLGHLLLVDPLPYPEQDRLYRVGSIYSNSKGEVNGDAFSYPNLIHFYKNQDIFEDSALLLYGQGVLTSLATQPRIAIGYTTPSWFSLLGADMAIGRSFEASEALDTFNPVAVLSHDTWVKEFNSSPDILQQKVTFSGISYSIVGVLSKNFVEPQIRSTGLDRGVWLPWDYNNETRIKDNWGSSSDGLTFVGRIKKGVSASQAEQILTPLAHDTWISNVADTPFFKGWSVDIEAYSFKDAIIGDSKRMLIFLITGVIGLVMIASANIANLFMSRTAEQQRQLAIFAAIGAKKSHLFRSLLAESSLLMLVSILVALAISSSGFYLMQTQFDQILPRVSELTLTFFTFGAAAVFAGLFALIFALISSRMINYRALNTTLQSSGKGTGVQVSKRFRQVLVVTQVAIATLLVFANIGLFNVSVDVINEPLGFNVDNMVNISVARPESLTDEEVAAAMASIKEKLLQLPQVQSVSHAHSPLDRFPSISLTDEVTNISFSPEYKDTDPTYFNQIGQALIAGNLMTEADIREETNASVVNEVFAKNLRPDGNVLGMKLRSSGFTFTVVGVVKNVKLPGQSESEIGNRIYLPVYSALSQLNLKLSPNQTITREQVIATIKDVSNSYSLFRFQVLSQKKDDQLFTQRSTATSTSTLTIITLFLAGVGLYGILSYSTQARRFEIGTRMAIGAKRNNLIGLIVRDNTTVIAIGILMSLVTMLTIYILNKESLASYVDMSLISAFAATLIAISSLALFACYWPLRKYINNPAIHLLRGNE